MNTLEHGVIKMMHYSFTDSDEPESPPAIPHLSEAKIELHHLIGTGGYGEVMKVNPVSSVPLYSQKIMEKKLCNFFAPNTKGFSTICKSSYEDQKGSDCFCRIACFLNQCRYSVVDCCYLKTYIINIFIC